MYLRRVYIRYVPYYYDSIPNGAGMMVLRYSIAFVYRAAAACNGRCN